MARTALVGALALLLAAAAAEAKWSPLSVLTVPLAAGASDSGDVCSSSKLFTKPSVAKVNVCSRSVAVSKNGGGSSTSSSTSSFKINKVASTACAEAVNDGVKSVCSGADPIASISSMASTCASALAEVQASAITGAEVTSATKWPPVGTKSAFATACASGCSNGQAAAEAVAQAAACAVAKSTSGCNAVKTTLSQQAYSSAFVSTTAKAWSSACALGYGKAAGSGELLAKSLVTSLSRAFGDVVAKACSECDACKCSPLAKGLIYDNLKSTSDTSAAAADGRFTVAKSFSNAAAAYCASDKSGTALKSAVDTTVSTLATMVAEVYAKTSGGSTATGAAMACSGASVNAKIQASKNAIVTAVADASSIVFAQTCASAQAKLDGLVNLLQDALDESYDAMSNACANGLTGNRTVNAADTIKKALDSKAPVTAAIGGALQDAVSCGCQPGKCIWCNPIGHVRNMSLSYDIGGAGGAIGNVTNPRDLNALLVAASKLLTGRRP